MLFNHYNRIRDVSSWNSWRIKFPEIIPELEGAELNGLDLHGIDLRRANLRLAQMRGCNLQNAKLDFADLKGTNLGYSNLEGVNLLYLDLRYANLQNARYGKEISISRSPLIFQLLRWNVYIFDSHIIINGRLFTTDEFINAYEPDLVDLHDGFIKTWRKFRNILIGLMEIHNL